MAGTRTGTGGSGRLWTGALAGYVASRSMDAATTWFHARQSEASRKREQEIAPGGMLVQLGKQLGRVRGRDLDDAAAARVGLAVHRTFGVTYGVLAAALVRRGVSPMVAGPLVGAGAFLVVDEGTSLSTMTAYPLVSHARGVVGHATHGLVTGLLLRLTGRP
ncbi:hypothetical protein SAMN04488107_1923 [Geodermatophilus saharensis]|uniref:DUF1440 domain-containing protein n=1 Tax=Geodermatophilus saharensis TaxID=1137994 RepID=A0A239D0P0_9ACTN|nr:hypothetical protein [Geodermatophilus saharensis]SNS25712.1 hypothetical protein SAMN04488107_1923 [Geodermatophilus saharensis]